MTKRQKILLSVCGGLLLIGLCIRFAMHDGPADTFDYTVDDGDITIDQYHGESALVRVPDKIEGLPVTKIGAYSFSGCDSLKELQLPDSITEIGDCAFQSSNLEEVNIPASLERVGYRIFGGSKAEKSYLDEEYAVLNGHILYLYNGTSESVTLPESITSISGGAFSKENAKSVKEIDIPNCVTFIGEAAFRGCENLERIHLPEAAVMEGSYGFEDFAFLREVTLPRGTDIGPSMFQNCAGLQKVTVTGTPSSIGKRAFQGCASLEEIQLPESVTEIGSGAFAESGIRRISVPQGVKAIPEDCFSMCGNLEEVTFSGGIQTIGDKAFWNCGQLSDLAVPESVETIGKYAFSGTGIRSALLPDTLKELGDGAFMRCEALTDIRLPDSLDTVPTDCFNGCTALREIVIPTGYRTIDTNGFYECTALQKVTLPDGLEVIGLNAFGSSDIDTVFLPDSLTDFDNQAFIRHDGGVRLMYTENCRAAEQIKEAYQHWIVHSYYYLEVVENREAAEAENAN